MKSKWNLSVAAAVCGLMMASMALAQNVDTTSAGAKNEGGLEEIVVTANRREQNLQEVPIAVEAFTSNMLTQSGIKSTDELVAVVPGLTFTQSGHYGTPFLRGVGNSASGPDAEPSVATYVDGVYRPEEVGTIFNFNNIERVEVLKGPQGTLFGRNATGGVIQIITKDPQEEPRVDIEGGYGNFDTFSGSLYATSGIAPNLAADIAVQGSDQMGGWGRDFTNGKPTFTGNDYSLRTKWLWRPDELTKVTFVLDYLSVHGGNGYQWHLFPGSKGITGQTTSNLGFYDSVDDFHGGLDPIHDRDSGVSLKIDHEFSWARFVSISAARSAQADDGLDEPALPGDLITPYINGGASTYTQEFQLLSNPRSKIDWVFGVFGINTNPDLHINVNGVVVPGGEQIYGHEVEGSYAEYGQATAEVLPATHLTVGLRYTVQNNQIRGETTVPGLILPGTAGSQKGSFDKLTYRFVLDHQFAPDILGYVSYNRGFKSGFFNLNTPTGPALRPEILDAAEIGAKTELFDHHLRLNTSAFHYKYSEIQVNAITNGSEFFYNGAAAKLYGLDADLTAVITDNLTLTGAFEVMHGAYTDFANAVSFVPNGVAGNSQIAVNATGNPTTRTPKQSGNLGIDYRVPTIRGNVDFNLVWSYTGTYTWDPNARLEQPATNLVNASLLWTPSPKWDLRLWGKNILDRKYYAFAGSESVGDIYSPAAPATYGFTVGAHFQ